jgi:hypothetical protein
MPSIKKAETESAQNPRNPAAASTVDGYADKANAEADVRRVLAEGSTTTEAVRRMAKFVAEGAGSGRSSRDFPKGR